MLAGMLLLSCNKDSIHGNGNIVTETRSLPAFSRIFTNSNINVHVSYGAIQKVTVKGYENLLAITNTTVDGDVLTVDYKHSYNVRNSNVEIFIEIPALQETYLNGNGDVWIDGFSAGSNLLIRINGSGDTHVNNSSFTNAELTINGNGDIKARGLSCQSADLQVTGSGDMEISCSQFLNARITGSGHIKYWGNPGVTVNISGDGTVRRQ